MAGLAISSVVFPNSMVLLTTCSLIICFLCAIKLGKVDIGLFFVLKLWLASVIVTIIYIFVGLYNGANIAAVTQVLVVYVLTPILWIFTLNYVLEITPLALIIKRLVQLAVCCCLSVLLYFFIFLNYGAESVRFFSENSFVDMSGGWTGITYIKDPIIYISSGWITASMYVFGSLIFLMGGYISAFNFSSENSTKYVILLFLILVTLVSGRSALMLSVFIGFLINIAYFLRNVEHIKIFNVKNNLMWLIFIVFLIALALKLFDLNFLKLIDPLFKKFTTYGGPLRRKELEYLTDGIINNMGLGSGYGIGVDFITTPLMPSWNYVLAWVASVFRVGLIGTLIYAAPFIAMIFLGSRSFFKNRLERNELFIFGGGLSAIVASCTNQYMEGFVFQWMYILPVLYFTKSKFWINTGNLK